MLKCLPIFLINTAKGTVAFFYRRWELVFFEFGDRFIAIQLPAKLAIITNRKWIEQGDEAPRSFISSSPRCNNSRTKPPRRSSGHVETPVTPHPCTEMPCNHTLSGSRILLKRVSRHQTLPIHFQVEYSPAGNHDPHL